MRTITLIPGDGIGPSVTDAAVRVVEATGVKIRWERVLAGMTALNEKGSPLPKETLDSITRNRVALKGPCDTPIGGGFRSVNVAMRKHFDTYVIKRTIISMPGVKTPLEDKRPINLVVFREGVEDIYAGQDLGTDEAGFVGGEITRRNCERFFKKVFDYAKNNGRRSVTIVHKANIVKHAYGLFLKVGLEVAERYPEIKVSSKIIDDMCMKLVMNPHQFDVIAAPNMFGDIVSEQCAGLVGGLGFVSGVNLGDKVAIFEAAHGTAPDIAGKDIANPTALILSAAMMLDYIGEPEAAKKVRKAVTKVIARGAYVTPDISRGSGVGTARMTDEIVLKINNS